MRRPVRRTGPKAAGRTEIAADSVNSRILVPKTDSLLAALFGPVADKLVASAVSNQAPPKTESPQKLLGKCRFPLSGSDPGSSHVPFTGNCPCIST